MDDLTDDLSAPRILESLVNTRFGHVEVHRSLVSTQTLLVTEGGRDGRVVVADHQTGGRGRAGRSWLDVPGRMLMFSALLRGIPAHETPLLSLAAGVAVANALEAVGVDARLKWPNDVLVDGRKVCGILGELAPSGDYAVIGIGVNVHHEAADLPDDINATSVRLVADEAPRRDDLLASIMSGLDARPDMNIYRTKCETIGRRVRVELSDRSFDGTATDVRYDGALIVDGETVIAGDVIHIR